MVVLQGLPWTLVLLINQIGAAIVELSAQDSHASQHRPGKPYSSLEGSITQNGAWFFKPSPYVTKVEEENRHSMSRWNSTMHTSPVFATQFDPVSLEQQLIQSNRSTSDMAIPQKDSSFQMTGSTLDLADWAKEVSPNMTRLFPELHNRLFMRRIRKRRSLSQSLNERSRLFGCSWWPTVTKPRSIFEVKAVQDLGLPSDATKNLRDAGAVRGVLSLGNFMILASEQYPESLLLYAANVAAEIMDPDGDGCPSSIAACFDVRRAPKGGAFVAFAGCHGGEVDTFQERYTGGPVSDLQTWIAFEMGALTFLPHAYATSLLKGILNEEIFHVMTQGGYCRKYPDQLGATRWNSTLAKAVLEAEGCGPAKPWYTHPENDCSAVDAGANMEQCTKHHCKGQSFTNTWLGKKLGETYGEKLGDFLGFHADCSEASCDIPEFYHKIMYLRLSVPDCWSKNIGKEHCADYYPTMKNANVTNSKTVTAALSKGRYGQQLLEIMRNPAFEQLQDPPTGVYVRRNTACPVLKANFSCMLYDEPESDEEAEEERREENQKREQELERKQELMRSAAFYPVATNFAALLFLVAGVEMCSA